MYRLASSESSASQRTRRSRNLIKNQSIAIAQLKQWGVAKIRLTLCLEVPHALCARSTPLRLTRRCLCTRPRNISILPKNTWSLSIPPSHPDQRSFYRTTKCTYRMEMVHPAHGTRQQYWYSTVATTTASITTTLAAEVNCSRRISRSNTFFGRGAESIRRHCKSRQSGLRHCPFYSTVPSVRCAPMYCTVE